MTDEKIARDLGIGLVRKGWILPHHLPGIISDLVSLIGENDSLSDAVKAAEEFKRLRIEEARARFVALRKKTRGK